MARTDYTFAREGDVTIGFDVAAAGSAPAGLTYVTVGCPKGTWTLGKSTANVDDGLDY